MSLVHQRRLRVHVESVNKKDKMETATGVTWTKTECERECWAIIEDDRPFHSDSFHGHANVQSKAVFSFAMIVMDKIHGWIDEEKWVGSNFSACMWICTKMVRLAKTHSRNGGMPKATDVIRHVA